MSEVLEWEYIYFLVLCSGLGQVHPSWDCNVLLSGICMFSQACLKIVFTKLQIRHLFFQQKSTDVFSYFSMKRYFVVLIRGASITTAYIFVKAEKNIYIYICGHHLLFGAMVLAVDA